MYMYAYVGMAPVTCLLDLNGLETNYEDNMYLDYNSNTSCFFEFKNCKHFCAVLCQHKVICA